MSLPVLPEEAGQFPVPGGKESPKFPRKCSKNPQKAQNLTEKRCFSLKMREKVVYVGKSVKNVKSHLYFTHTTHSFLVSLPSLAPALSSSRLQCWRVQCWLRATGSGQWPVEIVKLAACFGAGGGCTRRAPDALGDSINQVVGP